MLHHAFAYPPALTLLALLPVLGLLALWSGYRRRQALARLGSVLALETFLPARRWPRLLRGLFLLPGLLCLALGTAGPQWGRDWDQSAVISGRDLVVVLDCSRSMFAETPSRLERARAGLLDLAQAVEKRGGHRLALVVCAARARLACPLTNDYDHFREAVGDVDTTAFDPDLGPGSGAASGTRLGGGLTEALAAQDPRSRGARDILLLSDGDDPARDDEWRGAADEAARQGIPVHIVGIGDPEHVYRIPLGTGQGDGSGGWLRHDGREVLTRLQEEPLRAIAGRTHGLYRSAGTSTLPLGSLYLDVIADLPVREDSDDALPVYRPRYRWFLAPAFVLLALTLVCADQSRRARPVRTGPAPVPTAHAPEVTVS